LVFDPVGVFLGGVVELRNDPSGTAGTVRATNFSLRSLQPAGAGGLTLTLTIDQDFAYLGPPAVNGAHDLLATATFTAFPQSAGASSTGFIRSTGNLLPLDFAANPAGPFPQDQSASLTSDFLVAPAATPLHLQLIVELTVSDNASGNGPRVS